MVGNITSLTGKGLRDWLIQRFSAVYLGVYTIIIVAYLLCHQPLEFTAWHDFMLSTWMRILSIIAVINLLLHSWIGLWTVGTDYIKALSLRLLFHAVVIMTLLIILVWSMAILWGVTWL